MCLVKPFARNQVGCGCRRLHKVLHIYFILLGIHWQLHHIYLDISIRMSYEVSSVHFWCIAKPRTVEVPGVILTYWLLIDRCWGLMYKVYFSYNQKDAFFGVVYLVSCYLWFCAVISSFIRLFLVNFWLLPVRPEVVLLVQCCWLTSSKPCTWGGCTGEDSPLLPTTGSLIVLNSWVQ